jgi:hypothetical protein
MGTFVPWNSINNEKVNYLLNGIMLAKKKIPFNQLYVV